MFETPMKAGNRYSDASISDTYSVLTASLFLFLGVVPPVRLSAAAFHLSLIDRVFHTAGKSTVPSVTTGHVFT